MRNRAWYNFPAFDEAASLLRALGHEVRSPAEMDRAVGFDPAGDPRYATKEGCRNEPEGHDWSDMIDRDLAAIKWCDCVFLLCGWETSVGASAEAGVAKWMGKQIREEP
jgi:hypothetical protein